MGNSERSASIEIWQQPNGYWAATVAIRLPGWPTNERRAELFHDADEALTWARMEIVNAVHAVSGGIGA